jgi:ribosomal protein L20A (L18A)
MGLLKQYRAKATTFRDGKSAAEFVSKENAKDNALRVNEGKKASSSSSAFIAKNGFTTSSSNNNKGGGGGGGSDGVKKWKTKRAGAKERRIRVLRSLPLSRALTEQELAKMFKTVLQPVRAKYGGAGFAKPSVYVDISDEYFSEKFQELFDEHVEGFGGKSLVKMGKKNEEMLWKQRLKEKQGREQVAVVNTNGDDTSSRSSKKKRRRRIMIKDVEEETNNDIDDVKRLSRKQRKLALQRGEVVLVDGKKNNGATSSELQKQALLAAEAAFG